MNSVTPYGACNRCGCAVHECECPDRHRAILQEKIDAYLCLLTKNSRHFCFDCQKRTTTYIVDEATWFSAWPTYLADRKALFEEATKKGAVEKPGAFLCLDCLEKRLDRDLIIEDFPDQPINQGVLFGFEMYRRSTNPPKGG